ncbi:MAG: ribosomal-protein-alanine N-acetyltransferase [Acidobacteria bacterium]|nr:MAG: ribosomal-protein-alanine N-acetyltransferase [Acidobacteriota bacterium]
MRIRFFEKEDLPAILAIQKKAPQAAQWQAHDYSRLAVLPGGMILVADLETVTPRKVLGFAAFYRVIDEAEIQNLAVDPEHLRQGVARALLEQAKQRLRGAGTKRCFLEVRAGNKTALELYFSVGFGLYARRKNYYRNPPEDALVLCLELFPPAVGP